MDLIRLKNIGKIYTKKGVVAVGIRGVNARFNEGEFVVITGSSGSGKTTLLNMIAGADTFEEGEMYVRGEATSYYTEQEWNEYRREQVAYIFQDYKIIESFTALENVEIALSNIENRRERRIRAKQLLARVGLEKYYKHRGSKLSGGQKQRVAIARALAKDCPIILADEPTGNLDSVGAREIVKILGEVAKDKLCIVVTHDDEIFESVATRTLRVYNGAIEEDCTRVAPTLQKQESAEKKKRISRRQIVSDGVSLGFLRSFAVPKMTVFLSFVFTLVMIGLFCTASLSMGIVNDTLPQTVFNPQEGRLVISSSDNQVLLSETVDGLAELTDASGKMYADDFLDVAVPINHIGNGYINTMIDPEPEYGKKAESYDEALLYLPYGAKTRYGEQTLGKLLDSLTSGIFGGSQVSVCGIAYYVDNTLSPQIVMTVEGYQYIGSLYYLNEEDSDLKIEFFGTHKENGNTVGKTTDMIVDDSLLDGVVYCSQGLYESISRYHLYELDFTVLVSGVEYGKSFDVEEYRGSIAASRNYTMYVNADMLMQFVVSWQQDTSTRASLFFETDREAKAAAEVLIEQGYCAYTTDTYVQTGMQQIRMVASLIAVIMICVAVMVFFVLFGILCTLLVVGKIRTDSAIMRSVGYNDEALRLSFYVQMLLYIVPGMLVTACLIGFLYSFPATNLIFTYLHWQVYVGLIVLMIVAVMAIAENFSHRVFKGKLDLTGTGGKNS